MGSGGGGLGYNKRLFNCSVYQNIFLMTEFGKFCLHGQIEPHHGGRAIGLHSVFD